MIRMCQCRQHARSLQHRAALSGAEAVYNNTVANEPSPWPPPSPPSVLPSSEFKFFANSTNSDDSGRRSSRHMPGRASTAPGRRRRAWPRPSGTAPPGRASTARDGAAGSRSGLDRPRPEQLSLQWWNGYKHTLATPPFTLITVEGPMNPQLM
jgi:hypothetical protein